MSKPRISASLLLPLTSSLTKQPAPTIMKETRLLSTTISTPNDDAYTTPRINWYPGHIGSTTNQLLQTLRKVDVILEVRDARCPLATTHPEVMKWCGGKPRIVILNKSDFLSTKVKRLWEEVFDRERRGVNVKEARKSCPASNEAMQRERMRFDNLADGEKSDSIRKEIGLRIGVVDEEVSIGGGGESDSSLKQRHTSPIDAHIFLNSKLGTNLPQLFNQLTLSSSHINIRRAKKGLLPRPIRVGVIGYPNTGKSALINRLSGRRVSVLMSLA